MTDINARLEIYLGRVVQEGEVVMHGGTTENQQLSITQWNITDKPQPTIDQLMQLDTTAYEAQQAKLVNNANIQNQISVFEQKCSRGLRDALLRGDNTYLHQYDTQITALRSQLQ